MLEIIPGLGTQFFGAEHIDPLGTHALSPGEARRFAAVRHLQLGASQVVSLTEVPRAAKETSAKGSSFLHEAESPSCSDCGATMVRNGACYKCSNCGATSGCS